MAKRPVEKKPIRVLSLEDSIRDFELIHELLIDADYQPEMIRVETGPGFIKALIEKEFDIILVDFNLPEYDAYSALEQTLAISPETPFLVVSGAVGEETAIELIKSGAVDYVLKDRPKRLITSIKRALDDAKEKMARKQAEEALRKSEAMFANSFQYTAIGMALVSQQGQWLKVNKAFSDLLGYSESEMLSMSFQDVTHPDDLETDLEYLRQLNAKEINTFQSEKRYLKKDGGTVWALISVSAIYDSSGEPEFFITQVYDFTDRKKAEDALRTSEALFFSAFEEAGVGMSLTSPDGRYLRVNPALCKMMEYSEAELLQMHYQDVTHPEDLESDDGQVEKIRQGLINTYQMEKRQITKSGKIVWVLISVSMVRDENEKPQYFTAQVTNITDRKNAEEALRNSEALFSSAFENAAIGMNLVSPEGRYLKVNQAYSDMMGYSIEELEGRTFHEFTHPDDLEKDQALVNQLNAGEIDSYQMEKRYFAKSGRTLWTIISVALVRDGDGKPMYGITQVNDITDRKQAEEALHNSQALFFSAFDQAAIGMNMVTPDNRFIKVNQAFCELLGYSESEILAMTYHDITHPEDRDLDQPFVKKMYAGEISNYQLEKRYLTKAGDVIWANISVALVRDSSGTPQYEITQVDDITELKQAEGLLRESEQRYRELITSLPGVVYLCKNDEHYTMTFMTEGIKALTGLPPEDFTSQKISIVELYHPEDVGKIFSDVDHAVANHEPFHLEYRIQHTDGGYRWAEEWGTGIYADDQLLYLEGFITDITEQRMIEEELAENQRIFEVALKNSPVTVFQQDKDLRYTWIKKPHYRFTDSNQIGKTDAEFFSPEDAAKLIEVKQRVLESGVGERQVIHTSGEKTPPYTDLTVEPITDEHGEVIGITCSSVDISKLIQADEERLHRLAELEALINITSLLRSAKDVKQAAPILLRETLNALDLQAGAIHLYNSNTDVLEVVAAENWFKDLATKPLNPGQGIVGQVFKSGKMYQSSEYVRDPQTSKAAIKQIPSGWGGVAVPIQALDETIGVFIAANQHPQEIDPFNLQLLETIAKMAGITLHRMRLVEETLLRLEKLNAQRTIDKAVTSLTDLSMTLDIICSQSLERLPADAVGVLLFSPHSQELTFGACAGFATDAYSQSKTKLGEGYTGQAALDHQTIHLDNIAECDPPFRRHHLLAGENFTCYTGIPLVSKGEIKGMLETFHVNHFYPSQEWQNDIQSLATQTAIAIDTLQLYDRLKRNNLQLTRAYDATIEGWSMALDLRDRETEGHTLRVTDLTVKLAHAMGVSEEELVHIRRGALLHDMGKLGVPDSILLKPGSLTEEEWAMMREHPRMAYNMLVPIAYLRPALDIPYSHHEKWDGTGYPNGLKGTQIPLAARIFAVVDVFDALTSDRPYRDAWPRVKTLAHIREQAGTHFDPQVVEAFFSMIDES